MGCQSKPDDPAELPHAYTEGDSQPPIVASFPFAIDGYTEIAAVVERPDGTLFERAGTVLNPNQVEFTWTASDWVTGCSLLVFRLTDSGVGIEHSGKMVVRTNDAPSAVP